MPVPKKHAYLTVEEYLAKEERATIRHEFVDGQVYAMTGVSRRHNIIALNVNNILHPRLRASQCHIYVSDVKVRVKATNSFYYPDLMVSCTERGDRSVFTENPVLIVEVLSRKTKNIDRREKVFAYRQIPSLEEYLIIDQKRQHAELHRKNDSRSWDVFVFGASEDFELKSVGNLKISMADIYEGVDLDKQTDLQVREDVEDWDEDDDDEWDEEDDDE